MPNNADKTRTALTRLDERVGLPYSGFLVAGAGITLTWDAALGTYTIAAGGAAALASLTLTGILAPAALADATTENWVPGSLAMISRIEFTTLGASAAIGGLVGGSDGAVMILTNKGANILTVLNQSAGSAAANRFGMNGDIIIPASASYQFIYSTALLRWSGIGA